MLCRFVSYCMSRVDVLRAAGVTPVIVFDGGRLPMKEGEEESRSRYESAPAILDDTRPLPAEEHLSNNCTSTFCLQVHP